MGSKKKAKQIYDNKLNESNGCFKYMYYALLSTLNVYACEYPAQIQDVDTGYSHAIRKGKRNEKVLLNVEHNKLLTAFPN